MDYNSQQNAPHQIEVPFYIQNGVQVAPSTNYDLSRASQGTPIKPLESNSPQRAAAGQSQLNSNIVSSNKASSATAGTAENPYQFSLRTNNLNPNDFRLIEKLKAIPQAAGFKLNYSTNADPQSPANLQVSEFLQGIILQMMNMGKPVYEVNNSGYGKAFRISDTEPVSIQFEFTPIPIEPYTAR